MYSDDQVIIRDSPRNSLISDVYMKLFDFSGHYTGWYVLLPDKESYIFKNHGFLPDERHPLSRYYPAPHQSVTNVGQSSKSYSPLSSSKQDPSSTLQHTSHSSIKQPPSSSNNAKQRPPSLSQPITGTSSNAAKMRNRPRSKKSKRSGMKSRSGLRSVRRNSANDSNLKV